LAYASPALRHRSLLSRKGSDAVRPRVVLVDDQPEVLDSVAKVLENDFDVVAVATDGEAALTTSARTSPDVIVMDIAMPRLNGFQTVRRLRRTGSQAKVVFLTMHEAEEYVIEAFDCGGQGFVLKTRIQSDLASSLDHVLAGRLFVPSLKSLFHAADSSSGHALELHWDSESRLDGIADFFNMALRRGDATCLIGTERVREGLERRLRDREWDIGGPSGCERYMAIDAADALARFMRGGLPDADRLAEGVAELDEYRLNVVDDPGGRITIFGEMAVSLSHDGNSRAVVELEHTWNELTSSLPFFTVCSYPAACFEDQVHSEFSSVCAEHWAVGHGP